MPTGTDQSRRSDRHVTCEAPAEVVLVRLGSLAPTALSPEENWYEHLGLGYCASALRTAGFRVCIVDAVLDDLTDDEVVAHINHAHPYLVGLTVTFEFLMNRAAEFVRKLRITYDGHVTVGGHFPTFADTAILEKHPAISSVVRGEGEQTIVVLTQAIIRGRTVLPRRHGT
jgi:anaerobic magnesium-protoporphyrin IX monomethyl ester cyclase